jgi:hypothetical protein
MEREIKFRDKFGRFLVGHPKAGGFSLGRKHSESAKEKVRQVLFGKRGELARNWQGGKTAINTIIRYSTESRVWRIKVFERDDYRCYDCGAKSGETRVTVFLEADHIYPFAFFPRLRFMIENGRTLCRECHKKTPTFAGRAVQMYA